jgi:hypothetical protein
VAASDGPIITGGTYLVQRGGAGGHRAASLPLGVPIGAFLRINEPDRRADASARKARWWSLGPRRAATWLRRARRVAFAGVALLPLLGLPRDARRPLGLPGRRGCAAAACHHDSTSAVIPSQARTLLGFLLLAAGTAAGLGIDGLL